MGRRTITPGTEAGWSVIDAAVDCARRELGAGLLSAYAIGSLAHGGFRPAVSDVDLALLTGERTDREMTDVVATITAEVGGAAGGLGRRLSIFHAPWAGFGDPPAGARFPPIDRDDLVRYGVLVGGIDLRAAHATAPTTDLIRAHAVDSAVRRMTPAGLGADLTALAEGGVSVHDATKLVLWPVRLGHVCDIGRATGNADAVDHYVGLPDARHRSLVADALGWRDHPALPDPEDGLRRITREIRDLHVEVLLRLGRRPDIPRHGELLTRSRELGA